MFIRETTKKLLEYKNNSKYIYQQRFLAYYTRAKERFDPSILESITKQDALRDTPKFRDICKKFSESYTVGRIACHGYASAVAVILEYYSVHYTIYEGIGLPPHSSDPHIPDSRYANITANHVWVSANNHIYEYHSMTTSQLRHINPVIIYKK